MIECYKLGTFMYLTPVVMISTKESQLLPIYEKVKSPPKDTLSVNFSGPTSGLKSVHNKNKYKTTLNCSTYTQPHITTRNP